MTDVSAIREQHTKECAFCHYGIGEFCEVEALLAETDRLRSGIAAFHRASPADGLCVTCAAEADEVGEVDGFFNWPCPTYQLLMHHDD